MFGQQLAHPPDHPGGGLRARYRNSLAAPEPLTPGEPVQLSLDLSVTSNVFLPGHRIRLEVSSSNFPRFDRNTNTGGVIADETDQAAMAKWEHYKAGTDLEALAWRDAQAEDDPSKDPYAQPNRRRTMGIEKLPTNQGVLVGSYASIARMLDELAEVPGVAGVMLTFDDFVIGMEQFGTRILPLLGRNEVRQAA